MTGFFEKKFTKESYSVLVSIKTLNHRYFDWYFRSNSFLSDLENRFRQIAQREFHRGRVETVIEMEFAKNFNWEISVDTNLLNKILNLLEPTLKKFRKNITFPLDTVLRMPGVFTIKPSDLKDEDIDYLEKCFMEVIKEVKKLKKKEGESIKRDINNSREKIESYLKKIQILAENQPKLIEDKLRQRIENISQEITISEERLAQEVFFYIQRLDITEEINRLNAHLERVSELINYEREEPVGRKIEFLIQEIHREVNTIASKSQELDIIKYTVEIKGEIEKIRQQIQNIE
jgi:uncharacterized protein (TIGR00255 family)